MKIIAVFLVAAAIAAATYTDVPNDAAFYDGLLKNETAIKNLLDCLLEISPCDEFGTHAKGHLVESMKTGCLECSPLHKHFTHLFDDMLRKKEEYKDYFQKLTAKYDPEGVYMPQMDKSVAAY